MSGMNGINRRCVWESLDKPPEDAPLREWLKAALLLAFYIWLLLAAGGEW